MEFTVPAVPPNDLPKAAWSGLFAARLQTLRIDIDAPSALDIGVCEYESASAFDPQDAAESYVVRELLDGIDLQQSGAQWRSRRRASAG